MAQKGGSGTAETGYLNAFTQVASSILPAKEESFEKILNDCQTASATPSSIPLLKSKRQRQKMIVEKAYIFFSEKEQARKTGL